MWLWFGLLGSLRSEGGRKGVSQVRHAEVGEITACTVPRIGSQNSSWQTGITWVLIKKKWILA